MERAPGRHYTPSLLAARVVRDVVAPLSGRVRVCDPACGEGAFLLEARRLLGPRAELCGVDSDPAAVARARAALPGARIECGDALRRDWGGERFDAVIGNPPWVSFSGRHAHDLPEADRLLLARRFETFRRWPTLHGPFVELAVRLCRGRFGFLLPAQVCDLDGYGPVRACLRAHGRVESVRDYGEEAFADVTQPCCAIVWERTDDGSPGGEAPFPLNGTGSGDVLARLARLARPPRDAFADIGVHTGNCAAKLLREDGAPIREGKDVHPFRAGPPRRALVPDPPKEDGDYFRVGALERYRAVPILLRQTAWRPVAALHTEPGYFRNSVLACRGIPGVPDELVVAWLNSSAVGWWHRASVRESGQRAFPQVKLKHLRSLPMPPWGEAPRGLRALARRVARDGRLDLAPELDKAVSKWMGVAHADVYPPSP